jgi:parallel beta-helix repeat protein
VFKGNNSQLSGRNFLVRNCTFMDCENSAIYVDDDAIIEKNSFINNHDSYGGAIYVYGSNVIIRNNIFKYNTAIWGGAIYLTRADNCVIENNKFTQNEADKQGGAIELKGSSNIEIKNNTFLGNKANYGGAIDNFREYGSYTYTSTYYTTETRLESYWNPMHHQIPGSSTPIFGYNGMIVGYQTNYIWVGQTEYRTVTVQVPHTQTNTAWRYYGGDNVITNNQFIENRATTHGSAITNNMTGTIISANTFKINNAGETGKAIINTTEITNKNNVNASNSAYSSTVYTKENTNITSNKFTTGLKTTVITINEIKPVQYSDNVTITGTVTNVDYKAFSNAQLTLKINGETVSVKTNNKGVFTYTYKTATIGQNNISVTYDGNSKYAKATQKLTFDVIRKDTVITLNKINNTKKSSNAVITGKITSSSGVILKNVDVVIKINNKKFTVKSDSEGVFTYSYKTTTVGTNNVTVSYAGNSRYADVTKTSSFKVTEA